MVFKFKIIAGIEEAGRGPVIGPMVMAIIAIEEKEAEFLDQIGVDDSKKLSKKKREKIFDVLIANYKNEIEIISPKEIDEALISTKSNLNILEGQVSSRLFNNLNARISIQEVYLDCPSVNIEDYVKLFKKNLKNKSVNVIAEHKGFTESHTILVDITETPLKDGMRVEETLEDANIVINRNLLPWDKKRDRDYRNPGGIRLGTSETTRLGMKESEMDAIAEFITRVVMKEEDVKKVAEDVAEFKKDYQKVHYAFDTETDAYAHLRFL